MPVTLADGIRVTVRQPVPPRWTITPVPARGVSVPVRGPAGPPGPPGPAGAGSSYVHTQTVAASTWTITHGLARVPHSVTLYVDGDMADTDTHVDATTVVLTFATPTAGEAHIL